MLSTTMLCTANNHKMSLAIWNCCPAPGSTGSGDSGTGQQDSVIIDSSLTENSERQVDIERALQSEGDLRAPSSSAN